MKLIACRTALKVLNTLSLWDNLLETSFELQIQSRKDGALSGCVILHFNEEKNVTQSSVNLKYYNMLQFYVRVSMFLKRALMILNSRPC